MRARSRTRAGWRASQLPCPRRSIAISPSPHTQPPDLRSGGIRPFPSILLPASLSSPASVLASISTTARPFVSATRSSFGPCRLSCCYLLGSKASFLRKSNVPEQRPPCSTAQDVRTLARSRASPIYKYEAPAPRVLLACTAVLVSPPRPLQCQSLFVGSVHPSYSFFAHAPTIIITQRLSLGLDTRLIPWQQQ